MVLSRSRFLTCQNRKIHFMEWGDPQQEKVIIWHGVTGTCHDHEGLAAHLAQNYHVICPDAPGCGLSDWIKDNHRDPSLSFAADITQDLVRQLEAPSIRWIGSSKGGSLGMILAAEMKEFPITHLILNDVGPSLPDPFREAIHRKLSRSLKFDSFIDFEDHVRGFLSNMGLALNEHEWRRLAINWSRRNADGSFSFHYDPAIAGQFRDHPEDFNLWNYYDRITAKTLLIKGQESIVTPKQCEQMQQRGPQCGLFQREGGHVTMLDSTAEKSQISEFLES